MMPLWKAPLVIFASPNQVSLVGNEQKEVSNHPDVRVLQGLQRLRKWV
jgi:hypothetical protein